MLPEPNPLCVQVEKFFLPFELACHSKTPKIVCSALDSIEKLVAYGHISYEFFEVRKFIYYLGCTYSVLPLVLAKSLEISRAHTIETC